MSKRDKEMAKLIKEYCDTYAEVNGCKWYDVECQYFTPNGIKNAIRVLRERRKIITTLKICYRPVMTVPSLASSESNTW